MDLVYYKTILLMNSWLIAGGSPVAMMQHATSSQSIVFHPLQATPPETTTSTEVPSTFNRPKYEYKYEVSDHQTGDRKSHWEKRDGDNVRGAYTLYEPDGALRTVEYTVDALHGFNAVVKRDKPNKQRHSSLYPYGMPSSSGHNGFDDSSIGYTSEKKIYSIQETNSKRAAKSEDFSIVHKFDSN